MKVIEPGPKAIRQVRERLLALAMKHPDSAAELLMLERALYRREARTPAPAHRVSPTTDEAARIRSVAAARPDLSTHDIADLFNTNVGRVSEALHYDR